MNSTERPAFEERCKVLLAGYNAMVTPERLEAYWTGLNRMPMGTFERCLSHVLGPDAPERLPTPGGLWRIAKDLRANPAASNQSSVSEPFERFAAYGQKAMLAWLCKRGPVSPASLQSIIGEKNRLCDAYRLICSEEPEASLELRDKLFEAWEKVWEKLQPDGPEASPSHTGPLPPMSIADVARSAWTNNGEQFA